MTHDSLIDERVAVWAFFDPSANSHLRQGYDGQAIIFPIAMNWRSKLIKFEKVVFTSSKRVGEVKIVSLVCASDTANYELEYNSETYAWKLKKVLAKE